MSNPVVSVVMAVYNGEKFLKPTIESTLNQTFTKFEFVIVNDASVDKTKDRIHLYDFTFAIFIPHFRKYDFHFQTR